MTSKTKSTSKVGKKQVLNKVARTIKAKTKTGRKRATSATKYSKPLLSITFNGDKDEFVFRLESINGHSVSNIEYHVAGMHVMKTMGVPIMVTPFT